MSQEYTSELKAEAAPVTEAEAVAALVPREILKTGEGVEVFCLRPGESLRDLERSQRQPHRMRGKLSAETAGDFMAMVRSYGSPGTAIFLSAGDLLKQGFGSLVACFNYGAVPQPGAAGWGDWTATYTLKLSRELTAWNAKADTAMTQFDFADLIDRRHHEMVSPTAAEMLEIAQKFAIYSTGKTDSKIDTKTGARSFAFSDEHTSDSTQLPAFIEIAIPVLQGGAAYRLKLRPRVRASGGNLLFSYFFDNLDEAIADAVGELEASLREFAGSLTFAPPVFLGSLVEPPRAKAQSLTALS